MLLRAPAALLIEQKTEGGWRDGGDGGEEMETRIHALPLARSLHAAAPARLTSPSLSTPPPTHTPPVTHPPSLVGTPKLPLERHS